MRDIEKTKLAMFPPFSAVSTALMIMKPNVVPNIKNSQQNAKINAASLLSLPNPMGKYQQQNTTTAIKVFQTSSTPIMPRRKATQLYVLEGRSRASYSVRCSTNCGMNCCMSCGEMEN